MRSTGFSKISTPRRAAAAAVLTAALTVATGGFAAASATGSPTGPLTVDQLKQALPTNSDVAGYTFTPSEDTAKVAATPDQLTSGGPACQKFLDATAGLQSTYGTVAAAQRTLHEQTGSGSHEIQVNVMSFQDPAAASKLITDAKSSVSTCTNLAGTSNGAQIVGTLAPIPQLQTATDRLGYTAFLTVSGVALVVAGETTQVGSAVVNIQVVGPQTQEQAALEQLGMLLGQVTNTVIGKLTTTAS